MKWVSQCTNNTIYKNMKYAPNTRLSHYEKKYNLLQKQIEKNEQQLNTYYAVIQLKRFLLDMYIIKDTKELSFLLDIVEKKK